MTTHKPTAAQQSMTLERLQSLYELTRRINSVEDLSELLDFVIDRALSLTKGRQGLLLLSDDADYNLQNVHIIRRLAADNDRLEKNFEFVSTTIIKDVLKKGQPRLINDLHHDHQFENILSQNTGKYKDIRSVLAVPLKAGEYFVGLIYIDHPRVAKFGPEELDFLSAFASQAALAIHRTRQHQVQVDELRRLNQLSRSIVQVLDLDEVLTRIVYEVTRMLNVETGSVILLDEQNSELVFSTSVSNGKRVDIPTRLNTNEGIAGWVVSQGEPISINDISKDPRWFGEVTPGFQTHSLLCVPLQLNGRTIGALQALNKKTPYGFSDSDVALLSAFAASATIAIENARLFREARQAQRLRTLNEATLALSSTLDLHKILSIGLEKSLAILKAPGGAISLISDPTDPSSLTIQICQGSLANQDITPQQANILTQLSADILNNPIAEPLIIDPNQSPLNFDFDQSTLHQAGIQSLAIIPIEVAGEINGTLIIIHDEPRTYSPEETNLLESIGYIINLAVQNATNYNIVRTQALRLSYLNEVGAALTRSLDTNRVLKVIVEGVGAMLETECISIFLSDAPPNQLILAYNTDERCTQIPPFQQEIAQWVIKNQQPALINNRPESPPYLTQIMTEAGYKAHSILCVPLKIESQVTGVVHVLSKAGGRQFSLKDQSLLIELTRWASIALHNAHLYNERVTAYQRLTTEQQRRIAAETQGAIAAIVLDMTHTMNNVIGAIRVWAAKLEHLARTDAQATLTQFHKELSQIRQNAEEAIKLIAKITGPLNVATIAATDMQACLVNAIQSCWWPDNIQLHTTHQSQLPLVKANEKRLETVFHNLLSNAIQALTLEGGNVWVTTRVTPEGWAEAEITDDGPGIPPALQARMFNPGVSGKKSGLGIGLWLAETFIRQFEGQLRFTSSPADRTTFVVALQPINQ